MGSFLVESQVSLSGKLWIFKENKTFINILRNQILNNPWEFKSLIMSFGIRLRCREYAKWTVSSLEFNELVLG